ncbi:MAG: hypothetical protein JXB07_12110 [Anaerolineae bacterium]|nr:hypothetical protein [Anaerolineae bacterium]
MNTLPRAITAQILVDSSVYHNLRKHWSGLMRSTRRHDLSAAHHLLYLALLGKDWRRGFTCPTNRRKLENGAYYGWKLFRALAMLQAPLREAELLAPFDGLVTPAMMEGIRKRVPTCNPYNYPADQFTGRNFPFDAYIVTAAGDGDESNGI